jgi:MarR family 2-MHQ and catechol resistance regulon transcriptional repressor
METGSRIRLILWKAHKAVEAVDRASIASTGLGLSDFAVLEALFHKGPLPVNVIGDKVLLTSGSISSAVDRLERRQLVERKQDSGDGRVFHVHLTAKGKKLIKTAFSSHKKNLDSVATSLNGPERSELVRLLKKLGIHAKKVKIKSN